MIGSNRESRVMEVDAETRAMDSIVIALAAGAVLGLILIAQGRRTDKGFIHPMHSPNDRSRFATVRAIGDHNTYAIGELREDGSYALGSIVAEPGWDTIDKVRRPDDGRLYSSKPPLLPTLLAFEYKLLKLIPTFSYSADQGLHRTGNLNFTDHALAVVRILVLTTNWLPLVIFLCLYSRLLQRLTADRWSHLFALAAAAGGTYLSGFSVTLNNHTIAAFSSFFAIYPALAVWLDERRDPWLFAVSGFFAGFTAVLELPAAALVVALFVGLMWRAPWQTAALFLPLAIVPIAGHFVTNYLVTGGLTPAYAHKDWYDFPGSYWKIDPETGRQVGTTTDPATGAVVIDRAGIDSQYEPWYVYLFHMLLGHHGIFSLSPVFLFAAVGVIRVASRRGDPLRPWAWLAFVITTVLLIFYIFFAGQRNYGGMTNGLRWLFWLIPLWLLFLPAGLDWNSASRGFRRVACAALVISAASAFYATRNPWTRPWLQELLHEMGWITY